MSEIKKLQTEISWLRVENEILQSSYKLQENLLDLANRNNKTLQQEIDRYKKALEHYADSETWSDCEDFYMYKQSLYMGDRASNQAKAGFEVARAALEVTA